VAGVIHSDFEKGFIRAQVYGRDDLEQHRSENAVKAAGKMRVEGKTASCGTATSCTSCSTCEARSRNVYAMAP